MKIFAKFKWLQLLVGLVFVTLGVLTMVVAINVKDDYENILFIIWASVLFFIAFIIILFDIIGFTNKAEYAGLIISGLCIGLGVFVLVNKAFISQAIVTLLPYSLISVGGVLMVKTVVLAIKRVEFKDWLLPFILSVIFIASGIVFLIVKETKIALYVVLGILFIVLGAVEVIGFITIMANKRAEEKNNKPVKPKKGGKHEKQEDVPQNDIPNEEKPVISVEGQPKQIETDGDIKLIE